MANSTVSCPGRKRAKRETVVVASGMPASHASMRRKALADGSLEAGGIEVSLPRPNTAVLVRLSMAPPAEARQV